jgi:hypothetical protein
LAGCAGTPKPLASLEGVAAGTTAVRVSNSIDDGELDRLTIMVDGETMPLSTLPPAGGDPATVGSVRLPPGAHSIAVRAVARARRSGEVIVIGAQQPFLVQRGPSVIGVNVRSAPQTNGASPVAVSLTMLGGRLAPDIGMPPPDGIDQQCATLEPIPRAMCRAAFDLAEANRKNDVVASLCLRDKLAELRKLAVGILPASPGDTAVPLDGVDRGALADAHATALSRLAERCVGDLVASPAPDSVVVTRAPTR